jgi:hypothetical protein
MRRMTSGGMKILWVTVLILSATLGLAHPAAAYVVAVTTSISASTLADDTDLAEALEAAVDDVVAHAIAFRPAFVTVQATNLAGGRLYIMLLIGDRDGEEAIHTLAADREPTSVGP